MNLNDRAARRRIRERRWRQWGAIREAVYITTVFALIVAGGFALRSCEDLPL